MNGSAALDIQPRWHYVVETAAAGQVCYRRKSILPYLHHKWSLHRILDGPLASARFWWRQRVRQLQYALCSYRIARPSLVNLS